MSERHSIIPAVWVIVENKNQQVFLLRRANTGWRDGWWTVPAGHVEKDEGPSVAAIRELKEEAGISVRIEQLSRPSVFFYPDDEGINERVSIFFTLSEYDSEPINAEPEKADQSGWFDISNLPEKLPPLLRRAIKDVAEGTYYSERYYDKEHYKELLQ